MEHTIQKSVTTGSKSGRAGRNRYYSGPVTDHFDGTHFFNPGGAHPNRLRDLLKWQFGEKRTRWPSRFDSPFNGTTPDATVDADWSAVELPEVVAATAVGSAA